MRELSGTGDHCPNIVNCCFLGRKKKNNAVSLKSTFEHLIVIHTWKEKCSPTKISRRFSRDFFFCTSFPERLFNQQKVVKKSAKTGVPQGTTRNAHFLSFAWPSFSLPVGIGNQCMLAQRSPPFTGRGGGLTPPSVFPTIYSTSHAPNLTHLCLNTPRW